jgi:hypothetical protein
VSAGADLHARWIARGDDPRAADTASAYAGQSYARHLAIARELYALRAYSDAAEWCGRAAVYARTHADTEQICTLERACAQRIAHG